MAWSVHCTDPEHALSDTRFLGPQGVYELREDAEAIAADANNGSRGCTYAVHDMRDLPTITRRDMVEFIGETVAHGFIPEFHEGQYRLAE